MHANQESLRLLTELDFIRLKKLTGGALPDELSDGQGLVDLLPSREIPPDVVTMNSRVEIVFTATGLRQQVTLCYPVDAEPGLGRVSALAPIGSALLGLRVGALAQWEMPAGDAQTAEVAAILFQPEAAGHYTT
ncbi:MAG: GreA/GreB family elongation factor [Rhodoferax sp.]